MKASFPVVGIGASAGGLEAISKLLSNVPVNTGMAFVFIQHLDPSRESLLPVILQKTTTMPVTQATDGTLILPDHVYIIPPNAHMAVEGTKLRLTVRPKGAPAMSVNFFLTSLSLERGNKAIAVILSGTANDGSQGVKAIKAEGGIVFAQDEVSAGHAGMPHSAAATGAVDFVLPPEKIAEEIGRLARHPVLSHKGPILFEDTPALTMIFLMLRRATGVDFALYKPSTIKRRILRRMMLHKIERLEHFRALLEKDPDEVRALHDDLLIHVTHFFRETKGLAALRAKGLPRILKALAPDAPLRVWVPGCSTGEEAYTLAIMVLDFLSERDCMNPVQVFATDISETALERARAGVFSVDIQNHVSPRLLRRFFTKVDRGYEVVQRVRDACVFARQDLTKDPPFANMDVISCCNVLIYLGPVAQKRILPTFHYALRPSGALLLGSSETVGEFADMFSSTDSRARLYFKKPVDARMRYPVRAPLAAAEAEADAVGIKKKKAVETGWPETDVQKVAERILLARFAPAGVIVNGDLRILHFHGKTSRFLEAAPGRADLNLLKMLPAHAAAVVRSLVQKARKMDAPVKGEGLSLKEEDDQAGLKISIEVVPFRLPVSGERFFIVLFEEERSAAADTKRRSKASRPDGTTVSRLKSELASTRGYLQTLVEDHEGANEELKAANEEIVSSNEELQSTNEELEIAKEELQAANEELNTINEELQTRNGDLGLLNDDLLNLISSVHLPIVMVSSDLRIRRFSPMAERVMNLRPGDVGRPIGDITLKLPLPNIEEIVHEVIETVTTKELELEDPQGHSYALRIRPYKTAEKKIMGAVLVFIDNDPIKRSILAVKDVSGFEAVLELVQEPLAVLDANFRVKAAGRSMYQLFGLTESALGRSIFEIDNGRWDVPGLRVPLERLASKGEAFDKVAVLVDKHKLSVSARHIKGDAGAPPLILLAISDRTTPPPTRHA